MAGGRVLRKAASKGEAVSDFTLGTVIGGSVCLGFFTLVYLIERAAERFARGSMAGIQCAAKELTDCIYREDIQNDIDRMSATLKECQKWKGVFRAIADSAQIRASHFESENEALRAELARLESTGTEPEGQR